MTNRVLAADFVTKATEFIRSFAVAVFGLSWATLNYVAVPAFAAHPATAAAKEESVLVATREAPPTGAKTTDADSNADSLQPTAQSSDHTPDLAADNASETSAATSGEPSTKKAQPEPAKTAEQPAKNQPQIQARVNEPAEHTQHAAASSEEATAHEPVKFQGVSVAKTTKQELIAGWDQPISAATTADGELLVYRKPPFKAVEVLIGQNEIVSSIKITLSAPIESTKLAEQLSLDQVDPVTLRDENEKPSGQAFPERGVAFMYTETEKITPVDDDHSAAPASTVSHVVIRPIDARMFALRAESRLHGPYLQNIADLKTSVALDPDFAATYHLLAKVYLATGQADLADAAAAEACDIDSRNAMYQLCRAEARVLLGEYDDAVIKVRGVLDREDLTAIERARALHQMARLASLGDGDIASKTISFETRAIEAADKLATHKELKVRQEARQLLVEAHVAIAEEIARQAYNQKVEGLSQWVGRASGLAEDYIEKDGGSVELRLFISQRVLASLASFKPTLDPAPWVAEAEDAAKTLLEQSDDELWQQRVKWELGIAYLNALRIEHTRRQTEMAMKYGQQAIDNLAVGASCRQAVHSSEQLVGQLYFQMGAVYAVHKLDHGKAVQWYDKAAPLLTGQHPTSELYAPRREGEMLVSMGVSYWQLGNQARALELTQTGVRLVEAAVEGGVLAKSTLAVPYGNLATMYEQMGEEKNAAKYADLAKSVAPTDSKPVQRVGRTQTRKQSHLR